MLKMGANRESARDGNAVCDLDWHSQEAFPSPLAFVESLVYSCVEPLNIRCVGLERVIDGLYYPRIVQMIYPKSCIYLESPVVPTSTIQPILKL